MSVRLKVPGRTIQGLSIGGIETCFEVEDLDLCLDIGRCPPGADRRSTVLLTHGHIDHAAGLPYYVSLRSLQGMSPPKIYCPEPTIDAVRDVLKAWAALDSDSDRCELFAVSPGDEIPLRSGHFARVFRSPHRIATMGYTIYRRFRRLRDELRGLDQAEIAARARAGETVDVESVSAELCFPGDTRIEILDQEPSVTQARVLLLECTFCGAVPLEKARRSGHIHLDQIAERADAFRNECVVLTHWSRRHSRAEIEAEVERVLPASLRERVQLLL